MKPEGPGSAANPLSTPTNLDKDSSQDTDRGKPQTGTHALPGLESQLSEAGSKQASDKELSERDVVKTGPAINRLPSAKRWETQKLKTHQSDGSEYSATLSQKPSSTNTQQVIPQSIYDEDDDDDFFLKSLPDLPDFAIKSRFFGQGPGSPIPYNFSTPIPSQPLPPPPAKRMKLSVDHRKKQIATPVWPPKSSVSKQTERRATTYRAKFEECALSIKSICDKPISAKELWSLSNDGPAAAARNFLGKQAFEKMPFTKQNDLHDLLNRARIWRIALNNRHMTLEFGDSTTKNVTTQPCPPLSPALSPSTDTGYGSETSSLSISSSWSAASESGKKPIKSPRQKSISSPKSSRAILINPYTNCCFVNAVIHFLNATLSTEELETLAGFHKRHASLLTGYPEVLMPLSKLIDQIKQFERGRQETSDQVTEALQGLITACRESEGFQSSIQFKAARLKKSVKQPPESQTLKLLEHNDASLFLMDIWSILTALLPSQARLQNYTESRTTLNGIGFVKKSQRAGESIPFLNLLLSKEGSVQQSINNYFATQPADANNQVEWLASDNTHSSVPGARLPYGYYASSITQRLKCSAPSNRLTIRLELQNLTGSTQKKDYKACKKLIEQIFQPVSIPVEDPVTTQTTLVEASPCCILLHTGTDLKSGHYVTLEKTPGGWLMIDDNKPAIRLQNPMAFLQGPPRFDPYLISYDISSR